MAVNWSVIEARWGDFKESASQEWNNISAQRIADTLGRREDLASRVRDAYGLGEAEAQEQISAWQARQPDPN